MDGQTMNLIDPTEDIAARLIAKAEKLGREAFAETEKLLGMAQHPAPTGSAPPAATTEAPAAQQPTPQG